ncbi:MAG: hypothetical protein FD123_2857 [Bacteroidetes bacterium]|nr:MAG: hypothetical protein FD123_2857 [Bacteroidota bacterium]
MKKYIAVVFAVFICTGAFAKKVKFSVNMSAEAVDTSSVHIAGDFQVLAGFSTDWDPGITEMFQEQGDTNIYSVVVDIPAFRHYEFKFVNGIFGYQQEFVPLESRVNYNFLDNRWIYIDSLSNDTQLVGPIVFGGNAPAGKYLLRFYVDMQNETSVSPNGVHVAGSFQGWDPATTRMFSFDGDVYEYIAYVDTGMNTFAYEYKYANGNTINDYETVPGACATNGNRDTVSAGHKMLTTVCFSSCVNCASVGVPESHDDELFSILPNPASESATVSFSGTGGNYKLVLSDMTGRILENFESNGEKSVTIGRENRPDGMYMLRVYDNNGAGTVKRIVFSRGY